MTQQQPIRSMNISLPDAMRAFVEAEVARGAYSSASEYFRELVRRAERERAGQKLESALLGGVNAGDPSQLTPDELAPLRRSIVSSNIGAPRAKLAAAADSLDRGEGRPLDLEAMKAHARKKRSRRRDG